MTASTPAIAPRHSPAGESDSKWRLPNSHPRVGAELAGWGIGTLDQYGVTREQFIRASEAYNQKATTTQLG
jgi:hypothetical protein